MYNTFLLRIRFMRASLSLLLPSNLLIRNGRIKIKASTATPIFIADFFLMWYLIFTCYYQFLDLKNIQIEKLYISSWNNYNLTNSSVKIGYICATNLCSMLHPSSFVLTGVIWAGSPLPDHPSLSVFVMHAFLCSVTFWRECQIHYTTYN